MGTDNIIFLENLEWFDDTGKELVHRLPQTRFRGNQIRRPVDGQRKPGGGLFLSGQGYDAFGPGRHTLKTANIPILTKILSLPWGLTSPLRAEVYFVNLKVFHKP